MVSMVYYGQEITEIIILFLPGLLTGLDDLDGLLGSRNHEDQHLIPPWTLDRMLGDIAARHPDISWVIVTGVVLYQCNPTCILVHIMSYDITDIVKPHIPMYHECCTTIFSVSSQADIDNPHAYNCRGHIPTNRI